MTDPGLPQYWDTLDRELAQVDPAIEIEPHRRMSSPSAQVSLVRFTSIGHARLTGYLSVPAGPGPFPGLLVTPRYGSVNNPPHPFDQERYVTLVVNHRGQRLSDVPWRASYPELLTDGVDDPERFVWGGIAADCLRALEVLVARPEVDPNRLAVTGGDLALIVAARRPEAIAAVALTEPLLLHRLVDAAAASDAYPWQELNDDLRGRPELAGPAARTLALFDATSIARDVRADVLLPIGGEDGIGGREWYASVIEALGPRGYMLPLTHFGATDNDAVDAWLSERLGAPARPRGWKVVA